MPHEDEHLNSLQSKRRQVSYIQENSRTGWLVVRLQNKLDSRTYALFLIYNFYSIKLSMKLVIVRFKHSGFTSCV